MAESSGGDLTYTNQLTSDAAVAKASNANVKQFIKSATPLLERQQYLQHQNMEAAAKASGSSVAAIKSLKQAINFFQK